MMTNSFQKLSTTEGMYKSSEGIMPKMGRLEK